MTQEDKDLLLKDIFGRIPYGIKCSYLDIEFNDTTHGNLESFEYDDDKDVIFVIDGIGIYSKHVKPYLFPLSSMTEEKLKRINDAHHKDVKFIMNMMKQEVEYGTDIIVTHEVVDWCNQNHFDYRGLIEKGLAIDCTNLNVY